MIVWPATIAEATSLQKELAREVRLVPLAQEVRTVAGVDAAYRGGMTVAAAVLFDNTTLARLEEARHISPTVFPYVPGYLSFREGEAIMMSITRLSRPPDLIIVDGQGIAHPRRMGIASLLGVLLGLPSIGCAKSRLVGEYREPGPEKGAWSPLVHRGETVGAVLRTRTEVRPVFVSPGHLITLREAIDMVLRWSMKYRLPEPQRAADALSRVVTCDNEKKIAQP